MEFVPSFHGKAAKFNLAVLKIYTYIYKYKYYIYIQREREGGRERGGRVDKILLQLCKVDFLSFSVFLHFDQQEISCVGLRNESLRTRATNATSVHLVFAKQCNRGLGRSATNTPVKGPGP